jgi:hypothetical protein
MSSSLNCCMYYAQLLEFKLIVKLFVVLAHFFQIRPNCLWGIFGEQQLFLSLTLIIDVFKVYLDV